MASLKAVFLVVIGVILASMVAQGLKVQRVEVKMAECGECGMQMGIVSLQVRCCNLSQIIGQCRALNNIEVIIIIIIPSRYVAKGLEPAAWPTTWTTSTTTTSIRGT